MTANFAAGSTASVASPSVIAGMIGTEPNSRETASIVAIFISGRGFSHFVVIRFFVVSLGVRIGAWL